MRTDCAFFYHPHVSRCEIYMAHVDAIVVGGSVGGLWLAQTLHRKYRIRAVVLDKNVQRRPRTRWSRRSRALARWIDSDVSTDSGVRSATTDDWFDMVLRTKNLLAAAYQSLTEPSRAHMRVIDVDGLECARFDDVNVIRGARVVDIRRDAHGYAVHTRTRQAGSEYVHQTFRTNVCFVCVAPRIVEHWTIFRQWARTIFRTLRPVSCHTLSLEGVENGLEGSTSSLIGRQFVDDASQTMHLVSSGARANFWRRADVLGLTRALLTDAASVSPHRIRQAWSTRYTWTTPSATRAMRIAVVPNPKHLPFVFCASRALHSSGSDTLDDELEMADLALQHFDGRTQHILPRRPPRIDEVVYEGRVLDVSSWRSAHPGGTLAHIQDGTDVTDAFNHAQHPDEAWTTLFDMQVAILPTNPRDPVHKP